MHATRQFSHFLVMYLQLQAKAELDISRLTFDASSREKAADQLLADVERQIEVLKTVKRDVIAKVRV